MMEFLRAFNVERLKLKRTLALWLVIVAPTLAASVQLMVFANMKAVPWEGVSAWTWLLKSAGPIWALFVFPMLIAVVTALLGGLEHNNGGWKRLFALPVSRASICLAKLAWAHLLLALSNIGLASLLLGVGWMGNLIKPEFGFAGPAPIGDYFTTFLSFYLAGGFVISFHHWLANRSASFTLAMGIGIGATFIGMVQAKGWYQKLFPWKYMINTQASVEGLPELALTLGIIGGTLFAIFAVWDIARREVI
jgi:hypothetical protein